MWRSIMRINTLLASALALLTFGALSVSDLPAQTDAEVLALLQKMEQRIAELESKEAQEAQPSDEAMARRIAELEARLAEQEQETKEVKVLAANSSEGGNGILGNASTFGILANSAWRNLRWTEEDQWDGISKGFPKSALSSCWGLRRARSSHSSRV